MRWQHDRAEQRAAQLKADVAKSSKIGEALSMAKVNAVLDDLQEATNRDEAIGILQRIGQQLLDGTYPRSGR